MCFLSICAGFAIGGLIGSITVGVCASNAIADKDAHIERLRDALRSFRSATSSAVVTVRDPSTGRFVSAKNGRPEVQG